MDGVADTHGCPNCARLQQRIDALERQIAALQQQVATLTAALEAAQRSGKRQAAPFRKREEPKPNPKPPGRKSGDEHGPHAHRQAPPPDSIDETYAVALPSTCPHCGGSHLMLTGSHVQFQTEIPRRPIQRQFNIQVGRCAACQRTVQGRHPLQTSTAVGAAAAQLGPDAHAAFAVLNKELGLSHGKCARVFALLFGIDIARATSARSLDRTARRCIPAAEQLRADIRASPQVVADETGWRVGGRNAWLHLFVGGQSTLYVVHPNRSGEPARALLGRFWAGVLVHDGWTPYDRFGRARHQQCLAHLLRRCRDLLEVATRGAVRFPRRLQELLQRGLRLRDRFLAGEVSDHGRAVARGRLQRQLAEAARPIKTHEANERLAQHVWKHRADLLTFLSEPADLDATNWRAEQALRPAVVNRKVWGGNRTWRGAWCQGILLSVLRTCHQRGHDTLAFLHATLTSLQPVHFTAGR